MAETHADDEAPIEFLVSPYLDWVRAEGVPLHQDFGVNLLEADVAPWARFGLNGAVLNVAGRGDYLDSWLLELPAGSTSLPTHHLFEAVAYVVSGRGSTTVTTSHGERTFEWGPKSMFVIPLNATYQLFNASGLESARLALTTAFPITMNVFHDEHFVFETDVEFPSRIGTDDFRGGGKPVHDERHNAEHNFWITNFVPDLSRFDELKGLEWRGKASKAIMFLLADGVLHAHMSEIPPGMYKKAHRHMGGTHIYPVTGRGYSLLWYEGESDRRRIDWEHGYCYSPPDNMYHQHFNLSDEPARYFAVKFGNYRYPVTGRMAGQFEDFGYSEGAKDKKTQIEYQEEDPTIRELYREELDKAGLAFAL